VIRPVRAKTRRTCRSLSWLRPGGEDGSSVGSATLAAMTQDMPSHDVYVVLTGQFLPSGYGGVSPFVAVRAPRGAPAFIGFVGDVFGARETLSAHTLDADDLVIHAGGARPGSRTRGRRVVAVRVRVGQDSGELDRHLTECLRGNQGNLGRAEPESDQLGDQPQSLPVPPRVHVLLPPHHLAVAEVPHVGLLDVQRRSRGLAGPVVAILCQHCVIEAD
jgi:hypothetical protein